MKKLTLISTRPTIVRADQSLQHEAALDAGFCQQYGITEVLLPAFELSTRVQALENIEQWLTTSENRLPGSCMVVFVSPGALELLRSSFPSPWPAWLQVGLMGEGSASKAIKQGIPQTLLRFPELQKGETQDSAALFRRIEKDTDIKHVLLLKGPRGRDDFAHQVQALGIDLQVCQAYHRKAFSYGGKDIENRLVAAAALPPLCFYLTSSEAVEVFKTVIASMNSTPATKNYQTLVTHLRIAQAAVAAGYAQVSLIEPGQNALQDRLLQQIQS